MIPLEQWLRRKDVQRAIGVAVLAVIAAIGSQFDKTPRGLPPDTDQVSGHPRLVDGDSFHMSGYEVRMKGIDAPEGRQTCQRNGREWRCGDAARDELQRLIGGQKVTCQVHERDQHTRLLATCMAGERNLNAAMVASGMALAYGGYVKEETSAKLARRGLWGSEFQKPRAWRREHGVGG